MPITIGSNIAALQAQRRLNEGSESLSRVYERLSSGQRINHASDDAAGLAVASSLSADARIFGQALRNVNDGLSALSITEGALQELSGITTRISELAEQAANGVYRSSQRTSLNNEAQALSREFSRILSTTTFNGEALLQNSTTTITLQVGHDGSAESQLRVSVAAPLSTTVGSGDFEGQKIFTTAIAQGQQMAVGDLNHDGHQDVVVSESGGDMAVLLGNGDGTFKSAQSYLYVGANSQAELVDLNDDGNVDYVTTYASTLRVSLGNGNGSFKATVSYVAGYGGNIYTHALGDYNGDGVTDFAAVDPDTFTLSLLLGNGNGSFTAASSFFTLTNGFYAVGGDVNDDGNLDVVVTTTNAITTLLGAGNGSFTTGLSSARTSTNRSPRLADINGDGTLDLVAATGGSTIGVNIGNGDGTFEAEMTYATGAMDTDAQQLTVSDLNSDGFIDIITTDRNDATVGVLLNNGNGTFSAYRSFALSGAGGDVDVADFNEDGAPDIVSLVRPNAEVAVLLGIPAEQIGLPAFSLLSQSDALSALTMSRNSLGAIATSLGIIGAAQSRLEVAANTIAVSRENMTSAASRITDADIANDSALLTKEQILQQAASAILAQANQQPALALQLLRGG